MKHMVNKEGSRRYWVNDKLIITDISGTNADSAKKRQNSIEGRDTLNTSDIEGAVPNKANRNNKYVKNERVVRDVN
jgi:hypothetical protein